MSPQGMCLMFYMLCLPPLGSEWMMMLLDLLLFFVSNLFCTQVINVAMQNGG